MNRTRCASIWTSRRPASFDRKLHVVEMLRADYTRGDLSDNFNSSTRQAQELELANDDGGAESHNSYVRRSK